MIQKDDVLIIHFATLEQLEPLRKFLIEHQRTPKGRISHSPFGDYQQWFVRMIIATGHYSSGKACYHGTYQ